MGRGWARAGGPNGRAMFGGPLAPMLPPSAGKKKLGVGKGVGGGGGRWESARQTPPHTPQVLRHDTTSY